MTKIKINNIAFNVFIFFSFVGYYAILLIAFNAGMAEFSRQLTIPLRIITVLSALILYITHIVKYHHALKWFHLFSFFYFARIGIDYISNKPLFFPYEELLLYFVSFCFIPFISLIRVDLKRIDLDLAYKIFLYTSIISGLLTSILYGQFIGQVSRLTSTTAGKEVLNPLSLSYTSTLIIGLIITYLNTNKTNKTNIFLSYTAILLSIVPFFLGASRGSIFSFILPLFFLVITNLSLKTFIRYTLLFAVIVGVIFYLDNYLQSGLLNRFLGISQAIESGSSSASRIDIWKTSLNQFLDYPFFGDKLQTNNINSYAHNIFIEALQSVGILGFIPLLILIIKGLKASFRIYKNNRNHAWITVFFLQSLMQNMFSGALYNASWLWTGLAIVLAYEVKVKLTK